MKNKNTIFLALSLVLTSAQFAPGPVYYTGLDPSAPDVISHGPFDTYTPIDRTGAIQEYMETNPNMLPTISRNPTHEEKVLLWKREFMRHLSAKTPREFRDLLLHSPITNNEALKMFIEDALKKVRSGAQWESKMEVLNNLFPDLMKDIRNNIHASVNESRNEDSSVNESDDEASSVNESDDEASSVNESRNEDSSVSESDDEDPRKGARARNKKVKERAQASKEKRLWRDVFLRAYATGSFRDFMGALDNMPESIKDDTYDEQSLKKIIRDALKRKLKGTSQESKKEMLYSRYPDIMKALDRE